MKSKYVTYDNTPENARSIGWESLPGYCYGDPSKPKVTHDHDRGIFIFHD